MITMELQKMSYPANVDRGRYSHSGIHDVT